MKPLKGPPPWNLVPRPQPLSHRDQARKLCAGAQPIDLPARIEELQIRQKELERRVEELSGKLAMASLDNLPVQEVEGVRLATAVVPIDSAKALREIGDRVRDRLGSGVALLGGVTRGKPRFWPW